ncbi:MAG: Lrp/AsnC family transcriptional regulator [Candidatus Helarchaeota archaeon]
MLDEKNKRIINYLQKNGRMSLNEIGKKQGMSHTSIQKRLNKMRLENLIDISANINLNNLDYSFAVIVAEIEGHENLSKILEKYKNCPRIVYLSTMMGGHNLIAIIASEDGSSLNQIINVCSFRNDPSVRRSEVYICDSPIIPKFFNFPILTDVISDSSPCGLKCNECQKFIEDKCVGCPASKHYKFTFIKKKKRKKKA